MADTIVISGLRAKTHIGVTDEEKAQPQEVVVDVHLGTDLRSPGRSDSLGDTVDYAQATKVIAEITESSRANLLEHLAERVADGLLALAGVEWVSVEIAKDPPPVGENVQNVAVRIERP